ncbi:MAG: alanine--tRNA ligase [Candidatus Lokiarchaeota archaeon]|nr:alanine--tRNA ligase [Candidatus Lokiarchaeota archaeon]
MLSDKEQKKVFKKVASENPEKYYPVEVMKEKGFSRKKCNCGTYFWTTVKERDYCGDPVCSGGFDVVDNNPSKNKLSYIGVWEKMIEILEPRGYKPIKRYPVVARWNPTVEFTIASIAAFQPYVITGEADPPAKKIIIPQMSLRFNDIENVGITGSHLTCFSMIGQHVFVSPEEWNQSEYFRDIMDFLIEGVGLDTSEFVIHEDAWSGGGSFGPCLEFFSRGVELFNQVYTMFEQTPDGDKELQLKVLDMGMGQERIAWFSQGVANIYEATFPKVLEKLRENTNVMADLNLFNRFSKYSAYLNIDEVEDIDEAWKMVATKFAMPVDKLKAKILPMTGLYSIAEHSRALLFAITDGKLPSNTGGGYNLRVIFRRAVSFADRFKWDIKIQDVCRWHAKELFDLFPEVSERLDEVEEVLKVEYKKYHTTKKKASQIVRNLLENDSKITEDVLLQLYDSNGIDPDMLVAAAKKFGKKIKKPDNFYQKVVELHEQKEQVAQTHKDINIIIDPRIPETKPLYYDDYLLLECESTVLFIEKTVVEESSCWAVILDQTVAYPTSGGQLHDIGIINNTKFSNVIKFGGYIIHCLDTKPSFHVGDLVKIKVNDDWRIQLAANHTATHVINGAARQILGEHVNQASAKKTYDKAHLDITHFESLTEGQVKQIEDRANEIIQEGIELHSTLMPRTKAEEKYGMGLYQGGAVPGAMVRIVEIPGEDVEACGGTHMHNTSEIGKIKILKTQKIQDGIIRITFTGGNAVDRLEKLNERIIERISNLLDVDPDRLISRVKEIMDKKKILQKTLSSGSSPPNAALTLRKRKKIRMSNFDLIEVLSDILKCPSDILEQTILKNLNEYKRLVKFLKVNQVQDQKEESIPITDDVNLVIKEFEGLNPKEILAVAQNLIKIQKNSIFITIGEQSDGILINGLLGENLLQSERINLGKIMRTVVTEMGGKGGGRKDNFQGYLPIKKNEERGDLKRTLFKKLQIHFSKMIPP